MSLYVIHGSRMLVSRPCCRHVSLPLSLLYFADKCPITCKVQFISEVSVKKFIVTDRFLLLKKGRDGLSCRDVFFQISLGYISIGVLKNKVLFFIIFEVDSVIFAAIIIRS